MANNWNCTKNTFEINTKGNNLKALTVSSYHDIRLFAGNADSHIATLYESFHPLHVALNNAMISWRAQQANQTSSTETVTNLFGQMVGNLDEWEAAIKVVVGAKTPDFKLLFPNDRTPFTGGTIENRILALETLNTNLTSFAPLDVVKSHVDDYTTSLRNAIAAQQASITLVGTKSAAVEAARILVMVQMFKDLGMMIFLFPELPDKIGSFFDLANIQQSSQVRFTGHTNTISSDFIVKRKMKPGMVLTVMVTSPEPLQVYYNATSKSDMPGPGNTPFTIPPNVLTVVTPDQAGYSDTKRHLFLFNPGMTTAEWEILVQ